MTNNGQPAKKKMSGLTGAVIISPAMQEYIKAQGAGNLLDEIANFRVSYRSYRQTLKKPGSMARYESRSPEELAKLKQRYQNLLRRIVMAEAVGIASEV